MTFTLALVMVFSIIPFSTSVKAAGTITVYLTVSDKGKFVKAKDGSFIAWKEVSVTDVDGDGKYTFDEALVAAHKVYSTENGYVLDKNNGMVTKLWGIDTGGSCLFFNKGIGLESGVTGATVSEGDNLVAAILADTTTWSDWFTSFDKTSLEAEVGKDVELTLKGHLGMAWEEADKKDVALSGIEILDAEGNKLGTTDAAGKVVFKPAKAGEIIITASGKVKESPIIAPACVLTVTVAAGTKATVGNLKYQVADATTAKVLAGKKKTLAKVSVPATVTINGKSFKVTEIGPKAFKNNKKLKKVVIGANVKKIGSAAFAGDKKLKSIAIKSKVLKKVGSKAFKGINNKAVIKVPKAKKKAYKKLFKNKGQAKTVKIK